MSPIGRIFLVLNLILSAAFLGWASNALAAGENYKKKFDAKEAELAELQKASEAEVADLNTQLRAKAQEVTDRTGERDSARDEINRLQSQLGGETSEKERLLGDVTKIQATLGDYQSSIDRTASEKDQANQRREEAEAARDAAVAAQAAAEQAQRDAEDAQKALELQIADLQTEKQSLSEQLSSLDTQLAMLVEKTGVSLSEITAQPKVDGAVLAVDTATGLVMLNVGADQGVKRGFSFDVWSGNQYKGQVVVQNVQASMSSATIKAPVQGTVIRQGDLASTRMF
jgi:membrane carboxypeptidase/penicillin-binding protein